MKKLFLLAGLIFFGAVNAQFAVTDHEGNPILDGSVHSYSSTSIDEATLGFFVQNTGTSNITMKIQCMEISNATGAGMELCFGDVCLSSVSVGTAYPPGPGVVLAPGATNSQFDHFFNTNPGDGVNYPMDYVFRFYQLDSEGDEIGTPLFMTYRYTGTLATAEFELAAVGASIQSTLVNDVLNINANKNVSLQLFDVNGKLITSYRLASGNHSLDVSSFSTGMYIANFSNDEGQQYSAKIVKK